MADERDEIIAKLANYRPSVSRLEVDRVWRGITTSSGYAPAPELDQDRALCDLISFDDLRKAARAALERAKEQTP